MQTLEFQQPYRSVLLTSRQNNRKLSPKVTQVRPQINSVVPFNIKQHQQDDTLMRQVLYYNNQEPPKMNKFYGQRQVFNKQDYYSNRSNYHQLNINSQYYDTNQIKQAKKILLNKDSQTKLINKKDKRCSSMQNQNIFQNTQNNLNLNNRIQQKIQDLCHENKKIISFLQGNYYTQNNQIQIQARRMKERQKQIYTQKDKGRQDQMRVFYKSQDNRKLSKQINILKQKLNKNKEHISKQDKLAKQQLKAQRNKVKSIQNQLNQLRLKKPERQIHEHQACKQSYKQIQVQVKVRQINKRVQCNQMNIQMETKPQFKCKNVDQSDTDSQFSDF